MCLPGSLRVAHWAAARALQLHRRTHAKIARTNGEVMDSVAQIVSRRVSAATHGASSSGIHERYGIPRIGHSGTGKG